MADTNSLPKKAFNSWTRCSALKTPLRPPRARVANMSSNTKTANLCFGLPR